MAPVAMAPSTASDFPVHFAGRKYDLKMFLHDHPGGVNTLEKYRGKSIMQAMELFGHSPSAYHMMRDFEVGSEDSNLTGKLSKNGRIITKEEANRDEAEIAFLEEVESRLDWSKPLLSQLDVIAPEYQRWVNSAVCRPCRLFANPLLESLTYTVWYLVPMFWIPIISYLIYWQYLEHVICAQCTDKLTNLQYLYYISRGVVLWTAIEYSLHRWVFHFDPGTSKILIKMHFVIHGMHHKVPFDSSRQVFPPIPALMIISVLFCPLSKVVSYPWITLAGVLTGYLTYDMIHYYVHHGAPRDGTYLYEMKRYHSNHHFMNHDKGYGISSKIWDYAFRTIATVKKLSFSLQW